MTAQELIKIWEKEHPGSSYSVPAGAKCDICKKPLTADERLRNIQENQAQDGNAVLCSKHND